MNINIKIFLVLCVGIIAVALFLFGQRTYQKEIGFSSMLNFSNQTKTPVSKGKYIMLNAITWQPGLTTLPISDTSEITYFVLEVTAAGSLNILNAAEEAKFVSDVHVGGKKASFSISGGSENVADITAAVTTNRTAFINNIAAHITLDNYDGVTIDIENTNISAQTMVDFIKALRAKMDTIRPGLIIGIYTQPYQIDTVWANISQATPYFSWLAPMIYDNGAFNATDLTALTKAWEGRVGKDKLLAGVAVNYPAADGGLNTAQFGQVLDIVTTQGWKGVGIWENTLYTQPWRDVRKAKWPTIQ